MGEETSEHWIEIDQENGRFSRGSLPDGAAQLVLGGSGRLELFRSDWFELRSGEAIVPPGCDPLDLRGRIFVHRLQFQGPAGEQPERVSVMFPDEGVGTAGSGVRGWRVGVRGGRRGSAGRLEGPRRGGDGRTN